MNNPPVCVSADRWKVDGL